MTSTAFLRIISGAPTPRWILRRRRRRQTRAAAAAASPSWAAAQDATREEADIVVVGLGPGDPKQITLEAWEVLTAPGARVHVRTRQHPTLDGLPPDVRLETFDHVYETTKRLEDVYPRIAEELFEKARAASAAASASASTSSDQPRESGAIVYAVPGDPCVAENSVAILRANAEANGVKLRLIPGVSFLEPTLAAVGADVMPSLCVVDAIDVARAGHAVGVTVDAPLLLCQLHSNAVASDVKLTLMQQYPEDVDVRLVHAAGTAAEVVETLPLHAIDRSEHIGILSSAYVPALEGPGGGVESLMDAIARARHTDAGGESFAMAAAADERVSDEGVDTWDGVFGEDSVWLSADHADSTAVEGLRTAAAAAVAAAETDADPSERSASLGRLLAHVGLHVAVAAEVGEFAMRDVVGEAVEHVRNNQGGAAES